MKITPHILFLSSLVFFNSLSSQNKSYQNMTAPVGNKICSNTHLQFQSGTLSHKELRIIGGSDTITNINIYSPDTLMNQFSLKEHGIHLTLQMAQLANDREYINFCSHSENVNKIIADIAQYKYDKPKHIFSINHLLPSLNIPENLNPLITDKLIKTIPSRLNALNNSSLLAATSLLCAESVFHYKHDLTEPIIYLFIYDCNWQSMVIFRPAQADIIQANSYFVYHKNLKNLKNDNDVQSVFSKVLKMKGVNVIECK